MGTIRIETGTHRALNHISWGWELLYRCPLRTLHPLLSLWIFLLSAFTAFLAPWPMSKLLPFIKLHNSEVNEKRWRESAIYFYRAWPSCSKNKTYSTGPFRGPRLKFLWQKFNNCCVTVGEGTKGLAKTDTSVLHMFLFICIPATPWHSERPH